MTRWWMMLLTGAFLALFFVAYVHRDSNKHSNSKFRTPRYQLLKAPEVKNSEEDDRGWMTSPFTVFDGGIITIPFLSFPFNSFHYIQFNSN